MINKKEALTTHEMARFCEVTPRTIAQWIREGKIKAYQTPGGHSRVKKEDFLKFLQKYSIPIPNELRESNGRKRILVVDDDEAMTHAIRRLLIKEEKFDIDIAYDGFEAGQKFVANRPDLIILDLRMPKVNGRQLCKAIRSDPKNKEIKILIVSGIVDAEGEMALEAGADDYLSKPFDNQQLIDKIKRLFGWNQREEDMKRT